MSYTPKSHRKYQTASGGPGQQALGCDTVTPNIKIPLIYKKAAFLGHATQRLGSTVPCLSSGLQAKGTALPGCVLLTVGEEQWQSHLMVLKPLHAPARGTLHAFPWLAQVQ